MGGLATLRLMPQAGSALRALQSSSYLRIYLWPILSWRLSSGSCEARCVSVGTCGESPVGCESESIDASSQRNVVPWTVKHEMFDLSLFFGSGI